MKKKLLLIAASLFLGSLAYAQCDLPNCYGVVGFDRRTGKTTSKVDYSNINTANAAAKKECPSCEIVPFKETCAAIAYSNTHNILVYETAWFEDMVQEDALASCNRKIKEIGFSKVGTDRRRSYRQHGEQGVCNIVVKGCTKRPL